MTRKTKKKHEKTRKQLDKKDTLEYTSYIASEMKFSKVKKMLEAKGWKMARVVGSHHQFTKPGHRTFPVPVHHGKVDPEYVRQIQKLED